MEYDNHLFLNLSIRRYLVETAPDVEPHLVISTRTW
jgi:hypothetical protein